MYNPSELVNVDTTETSSYEALAGRKINLRGNLFPVYFFALNP